jgi:two-component system, LuxR family, response regulator FixJ
MTDVNTVYVVDDDEAVRESIAVLLEVSGLRAESFASADDLLANASALGSGCVVTDVRMPGTDGITLLRRLSEQDVHVPVIVMTGHGDIPLAVQAMRAGAKDFIEKPFDEEVLLASVRAALAGRGDPAETGQAEALDPVWVEIRGRLAKLSAREAQVLEGLVAGRQNKTIARELDISPRTVEIYRSHVMTKMQAATLSDLVRMALIAEMKV